VFLERHFSAHKQFKQKLSVTSELAAITTGHGFTKSFLYRFRILENSTCGCLQEKQCTILNSPVEIDKIRMQIDYESK
jgi:hypothetical protein